MFIWPFSFLDPLQLPSPLIKKQGGVTAWGKAVYVARENWKAWKIGNPLPSKHCAGHGQNFVLYLVRKCLSFCFTFFFNALGEKTCVSFVFCKLKTMRTKNGLTWAVRSTKFRTVWERKQLRKKNLNVKIFFANFTISLPPSLFRLFLMMSLLYSETFFSCLQK